MTTLKEFRLDIDRCINTARKLDNTREVSLAHTNLQRAKMWLGKALGKAGAINPYPNSENSSNAIIEAQADHGPEDYFMQPEWNQTQRVKELRNIIQRITDSFEVFQAKSETFGSKYDLYCIQSLLAAEEAKMWLGWELNRIYESTPETAN